MKGKYLIRPRIEDHLEKMMEFPLMIVSGAMGYGKTTAVKKYLRRKDVKVIWVSLFDSLGDETALWDRLTQKLYGMDKDAANCLNAYGIPIDNHQSFEIICQLKKIAKTKPMILVIDDYHLMQTTNHFEAFLKMLLEEKNSNFHVVLISRTFPSFMGGMTEDKKLCYSFTGDDLAFTSDEVKEYFEMMEYETTDEECRKVVSYTNGWISAIYVILLGLKRGRDVLWSSDIYLLLEKHYFTDLSKQMREDILNLAILERFTLEQAKEILQSPGIEKRLEKVVETNAFVQYSSSKGEYHFHPVLLNYLREKASEDNWNYKEICRRAGMWFIQQGDIIRSMEYYDIAGEIQDFFQYVDTKVFVDLGYLGQDVKLGIYQGISHRTMITYPIPILQLAMEYLAYATDESLQYAKEILSVLEKHYGKKKTADPVINRINGEIQIVKATMAFNNLDKLIQYTSNADALFGGGMSWNFFPDTPLLFGLPSLLYTFYTVPGKLKKTAETLKMHYPPRTLVKSCKGISDLVMAEYNLLIGEKNACQESLEKIFEQKEKIPMDVFLASSFCKIRLYLAMGKPECARLILQETEEFMEINMPLLSKQNKAIFMTTLELIRGYTYGCLGEIDCIPRWIFEEDSDHGVYMFEGLGYPAIIDGFVRILQGEYDEFLYKRDTYLQAVQTFHNQMGSILINIFSAIAKYHCCMEESAAAELREVVRIAKKDKVILPFRENRELLSNVIQCLDRDSDDYIWLRKIID